MASDSEGTDTTYENETLPLSLTPSQKHCELNPDNYISLTQFKIVTR